MLTAMFFAFYFFSSINSFAEELPKLVKTELIADVSNKAKRSDRHRLRLNQIGIYTGKPR
jgi:hypothetical protein